MLPPTPVPIPKINTCFVRGYSNGTSDLIDPIEIGFPFQSHETYFFNDPLECYAYFQPRSTRSMYVMHALCSPFLYFYMIYVRDDLPNAIRVLFPKAITNITEPPNHLYIETFSYPYLDWLSEFSFNIEFSESVFATVPSVQSTGDVDLWPISRYPESWFPFIHDDT